MTKVIGYIRVSSAQQVADGESLERQEQQIINYCQMKGLAEPKIIKDAGLSGFKVNRPGYQKIVSMCRAGEISTLIVYDLSRLSRSVRHTLEFVDEIINKHSITFISLKQDINTQTATGRAFLTIASVFNQLYRDEIAEKTKAAIAHKNSRGECTANRLPYGYSINAQGQIFENTAEQQVILQIIKLRDSGLSYKAIAKQLNRQQTPSKKGGTNWHEKTVYSIYKRATASASQPNAA